MAFYPTYPQSSNQQAILSGQIHNVGLSGLGQAFSIGQSGINQAGTGNLGQVVGIGSLQWLQQVQQQNPVVSLPPPTGMHSYVAYRNPVTGHGFTLHVDDAYVQIMYDIATMQSISMMQTHYIPVTTMPDDEFSLDEMGQAEDLIQEIEHAH